MFDALNSERAAICETFRYSGHVRGHELRCGAALAIHNGERNAEAIEAAAQRYAYPEQAPEPRPNGKKGRKAARGEA